MEWEFPAPETREATRNAAITASTPMNRDLRIQHAMTGDVGHDQRREFAGPALHARTPEISLSETFPALHSAA